MVLKPEIKPKTNYKQLPKDYKNDPEYHKPINLKIGGKYFTPK